MSDRIFRELLIVVVLGLAIGLLLAGCGEYATPLGIRVEIEPGADYPGDDYVDRSYQAVAAVFGDLPIEPEPWLRIRYRAEPQTDCRKGVEAIGCYRPQVGVLDVTRDWGSDPCQIDALPHELVHHWEHLTARSPPDQKRPHAYWPFEELLPLAEESVLAGCDFSLHPGE